MGVPQVVIVGRPNVGKSSLFNWLAERRLAIVDPTAGVTRDRMSHLMEIGGRFVEIVDTGGMGVKDVDNLTEHIEEQIQTAIDEATVILFVVDTLEGIVPLDEEVVKRLRQADAPVVCVANKTDHGHLQSQADEFYRFGKKIVAVSTKQNRGKQELLDAIAERLPQVSDDEEALMGEPEMRVAIVGRRNTGKSTMINTLVEANRMITSEVPGTTRDSVDVRFEMDGKGFVAIDTPGFRRRKSVSTDIDFYSTHRAQRSIRRADVVLLFFDATQRISKVDRQLCDYITEQYKPCILVVNKWDLLVGTMPTEKWVTYLRDTFRTMWYAPIAFVTGQTGHNVKTLFNHAQMLFKQSRMRVGTPDLNKLVKAALELNPPPVTKHRRPKIFYATQVAVQPPTVLLFCNEPKSFSATYRRYLLGVFRDQLPFGEVPIKLYLRKRESHEPVEGSNEVAEGDDDA
ncbi:MAG: ribosome biogenesis GTPase Der [Pirellulaceae bacterium]|nr:ribosome biogenesis GTPase Der [Pirellulaceae bacterium]